MDSAAVVSAVAEACPSLSGRQFADAASEYSKLAGVLAGFAFTGLVFILRERVSSRYAAAVEVLVFAFFGLVLTSANYAIITGEEADYAAGRAVSEAVFAGAAFSVAGILLLFSIVLLLDAVDAPGDPGRDGDGEVAADESPFGRVKRHLGAITATFVTFVLILMAAPGARTYAAVTDREAVEVVGGVVVVFQLVLSSAIGISYLLHRRRAGRTPPAGWSGAWRFALVSVGFVLLYTLACQWAGAMAPCEQIPWPVIAVAVALHGAMIGHASVVIGRPWLSVPRPMRSAA